MFLKKMGGVILVGSVVVWTLSAFPRDIDYSIDYDQKRQQIAADYDRRMTEAKGTGSDALAKEKASSLAQMERRRRFERAEKSYMGKIGQAIGPIFSPLGIDWRSSVALVTGFFAKEIVVSTLGVLYAVGDENESEALQQALQDSDMTPLSAYAMMAFVLLYVPCIATVTTIRQETGSSRWMLFSVVYSTALAWAVAFAIYQGGRIFGLG
jgi:ferrous iron transport protein B